MTNTLYEVQEEILKYFRGQEVNTQILSDATQNELSVYKSLIINSEEDFLSKIFPLSYQILSNKWREVITLYYENYPSKSPIFNQLGLDFPEFLKSNAFLDRYGEEYPNYLAELNLYEQTEFQIYNAENLTSSNLVCPNLQILEFQFPISQIKLYLSKTQDTMEEIRSTDMEEEPEIICIFRPQEASEIQIKVINKASKEIIEALQQGQSLENILQEISQKLTANAGPELELQFKNLIKELQKIKLLLN